MTIRRIRSGEALAGVAALGLAPVLFLDWFRFEPPSAGGTVLISFGSDAGHSGLEALGWPILALLVLLICGGLALVLSTIRGRPVAWPVTIAVVTSFVGLIATPALAIRLALGQPALDLDLPDRLVGLRPAAYAGLVLAVLVTIGAWRSMGDERTGAPESAYTPPPARPLPPGA